MEQSDTFELKLKDFCTALDSFEKLLSLDLSAYSEIEADGLKNGQIQKFEYSAELMWKSVRKFLLVHEKVQAGTPRSALKEFYLAGRVSEKTYEDTLEILDARNQLSHLYKQDLFDNLYAKLPHFLKVMLEVRSVLTAAF